MLELAQFGPASQSGDHDGIDLISRKTVSLRQRPRNSLGPSSGHPPTVGDGLDSLPENHTSGWLQEELILLSENTLVTGSNTYIVERYLHVSASRLNKKL